MVNRIKREFGIMEKEFVGWSKNFEKSLLINKFN